MDGGTEIQERSTGAEPAGGGPFDGELERVTRVYEARAGNTALARAYEPIFQAALFTVQGRQWAMADLLRRSGLATLSGLDILDVGCGLGLELRRLATMGADPARMAGIDLMPERVAGARQAVPQARLVAGSAHKMPFEAASFDLVTQFTVFSSIVDAALRQAIATEIARVLRPDGRLVWYDMFRMNPSPDLVAMDLAEVRRLFPGWRLDHREVTLRWSLVHRVVPRSRSLGLLLERLPRGCSHYLVLLRPPGA